MALKDISKRQKISINYLEQLFVKLRRAGIITSVRGPKGGYKLSKPAKDITIGDILRVVEGPISPVPHNEKESAAGSPIPLEVYVTRLLWKRLGDKMAEFLDSTSLEDLCAEAKELKSEEPFDHYFMFYI